MKEGESELGGLQIPHGNTTPSMSAPGTQPVVSAPSQIPQVSQTPQSPQTPPLVQSPSPAQLSATPSIQPASRPPQSSDRLFSQTFTTNSTAFSQPYTSTSRPQIVNQAQSQPQAIFNSMEDITISGTQPTKSRKRLIIGIIIAITLVTIGAITFFLTQNNGNLFGGNSQQEPQLTKKEVYDALWEFNFQYYSNMLGYYENSIGLQPRFEPNEFTLFFPLANWMEYLPSDLKETINAYNEIEPKIPDYLSDGDIDLQPVKNEINQSLQAMQYNINLLNEFYQAYYLPLEQNPKPSTCNKTQAMLDLDKGNTATASELYYNLYCETVNILSDSSIDIEALRIIIAEPTATAATSLNELLIDVPSANESIENLFKELTQ